MKQRPNKSDSLITACRRGDRRAQEAFYRQHFSRLLPICQRYLRNREEAVGVPNQAMLRVFQSLEDYQEIHKLEAWLATIVRRTALNFIRDEGRARRRFQPEHYDPPASVANAALGQLNANDILKLLHALPDHLRTVFSLLRGATTSQLQALFVGPAAGATPENDRKIYAQARLMQFNYRQVGGLVKLASFDGLRFDKYLMIGAGLRFIHGERVHIGASELGRDDNQLQLVTDGYEIDARGIRPSTKIDGGILLKENMLRKVVPFAEAGFNFENESGMSLFALLQFNLAPAVDPAIYKNQLAGNPGYNSE